MRFFFVQYIYFERSWHGNAFRINGPLWVHVSMSSCLYVQYNDVTMGTMASQITSLTTVYLTVYSRADQRKHQSSTSLAFARGILRWPVNSPHQGPVTRKMLPFDAAIMDEVQTDRNAPNVNGISSPQQLKITIRSFDGSIVSFYSRSEEKLR